MPQFRPTLIPRRVSTLGLALAVGAFADASDALAAVACVSTAAELSAAMAEAQSNQADDEIRVRAGTYQAPPGGWTLDLLDGESGIEMTGGWTDAGCTARDLDANLTVLDGGHQTRILTIATSQSGGSPTASAVVLSGFTFANGLDATVAAVKISDPGPIYGGTIHVEGNVFRDNETTEGEFLSRVGPALLVATDGPDWFGGLGIVVRNNLFLGNAGPTAPALFAFSNNDIQVTNNTFVRNQATDATLPARAVVGFYTLSTIGFANDIFWSNNTVGGDGAFDLVADEHVLLYHTNIAALSGAPAASVSNTSVDPQFVDPVSDFALAEGSPLIDAGVDGTEAFRGFVDVRGQARLQGEAIDLGAYEAGAGAQLLSDGFE